MKRPSPIAKPALTVKESQLITGALHAFKAIPNLAVKEIVPGSKHPDHGLDFTLQMQFGTKKFKVGAEVKSSGEPSVLRRSAAWLKGLLTKTKHDYGILVAPYISGEGTAICRELGVGF